MTDSDDIDLNTLGDDELVAQMHGDLCDVLKEGIEEGVDIFLARGWELYKVLTEVLFSHQSPPNDIGLGDSQ